MSDQTHHFPIEADAPPARPGLDHDRPLAWLVAAALILGGARRLLLGWNDPLSLDETWTGAIAAVPDVATLVQRCLHELSGPLFYGSQWLWAKIAGVSDAALRAPAIAASIATPLLILLAGHPERRVRLLWAGMAAAWVPGTLFAAQARPYSLAILLATAQVIALARLLRAPTLARAFAWSGTTTLLLLCHYSPFLLCALQGVAIFAWGPRTWRCWPALLAFAPLAAWLPFHLPTLFAFSAPGVAWQPVYGWATLAALVPAAMFGIAPLGIALIAAIAVTTLWLALPSRPRDVRARLARGDAAAALSGVGAVLVIVAIATLRPTFSARYLLPMMPAILFGVAVWASAWSRRWPLLPALVISAFLLLAAGEARLRVAEPPDRAHGESIEAASRMIGEAHPRRLFVLFDGSEASRDNLPMLRDVGGFILARDGRRADVHPLVLAGMRVDPNRLLPKLADRRDDALLWIYNAARRGTLGAAFPAAIPRHDLRWSCRDFGAGALAVIACVQPPTAR